jgi:hypothetical protein
MMTPKGIDNPGMAASGEQNEILKRKSRAM